MGGVIDAEEWLRRQPRTQDDLGLMKLTEGWFPRAENLGTNVVGGIRRHEFGKRRAYPKNKEKEHDSA